MPLRPPPRAAVPGFKPARPIPPGGFPTERDAYLLMRCRTRPDAPPEILDVHIYSEEHPTSRNLQTEFYAQLARCYGRSYEDAVRKVLELTELYPSLRWTRAYLQDEIARLAARRSA